MVLRVLLSTSAARRRGAHIGDFGVIYSIVGTCKLLQVNPESYLTWVLPKLAAATTKTAHGLLPQHFAQQHLHSSSGERAPATYTALSCCLNVVTSLQ
jgi:hypothetical protein